MQISRRKFLTSCGISSLTLLAGCNAAETLELGAENEFKGNDSDFDSEKMQTAVVEKQMHGKNIIFKNLDFRFDSTTKKYEFQLELYPDASKYCKTVLVFLKGSGARKQKPVPKDSSTIIIPFDKEAVDAEIQVVSYSKNGDVVSVVSGTLFQTIEQVSND